MISRIAPILLLAAIAASPTVTAAESLTGVVPLFSGKNLDGRVNVNCAPETWTIRYGLIVCTGVPFGKKLD